MPITLERPPAPKVPARSTSRPRADAEYQPFGNMQTRNGLQELVEIPMLLLALRLPSGGRVLEIGCGRGVALPVLARYLRPARLVGVDIDPALVDVARARVGDCASIRPADVRDLPFDDASFDLVIDFGTCYHVSGGEDGRRQALREVARVLRVDGLFVHETRVAQHLAHPVRALGRRLPWRDVASLAVRRRALLWTARRRIAV